MNEVIVHTTYRSSIKDGKVRFKCRACADEVEFDYDERYDAVAIDPVTGEPLGYKRIAESEVYLAAFETIIAGNLPWDDPVANERVMVEVNNVRHHYCLTDLCIGETECQITIGD